MKIKCIGLFVHNIVYFILKQNGFSMKNHQDSKIYLMNKKSLKFFISSRYSLGVRFWSNLSMTRAVIVWNVVEVLNFLRSPINEIMESIISQLSLNRHSEIQQHTCLFTIKIVLCIVRKVRLKITPILFVKEKVSPIHTNSRPIQRFYECRLKHY